MFESKPRAGAHVWSQTSSESSCLEPSLGWELMFWAKPRARAYVWTQTSSESSCLEPNPEPELMFGAKPRAGAHVWSQTSSGSAFGLSRATYAICTVLSKAQVSKRIVFTVFLHVRRRSRAKSDFWDFQSSTQTASATYFLMLSPVNEVKSTWGSIPIKINAKRLGPSRTCKCENIRVEHSSTL